ncbi:12729_t:CDS:1, partial [Cetraspora pellucida]
MNIELATPTPIKINRTSVPSPPTSLPLEIKFGDPLCIAVGFALFTIATTLYPGFKGDGVIDIRSIPE